MVVPGGSDEAEKEVEYVKLDGEVADEKEKFIDPGVPAGAGNGILVDEDDGTVGFALWVGLAAVCLELVSFAAFDDFA
jgi:hypothetical protein